MFNADIWVPVIRDLVASAAPIAFVLCLVKLGFNLIIRAASGDGVFNRRY